MLPRREKEKQKVMVARLLGGCQESLAATGTMGQQNTKGGGKTDVWDGLEGCLVNM